ncbi:hypothetical protein ACF0H5_017089 [Mactra antiquata]
MNASFVRRYGRKCMVLCGFLILISMVIMLQYLEHSSARRLLILSKPDITGSMTSTFSNKRNPWVTPDPSLTIAKTKAFLRNITVKPSLKLLINATKTKYPVTIDAPYLLHDPKLCSSVRNLSVLVIVHTAPDHFDRRNSMRETWTNETYYRHLGRLRVLFLLGRVNDYNLQLRIEEEFKTHKDLLQGDFVDAYRNLTHKGVMGYKWISEYCRNAKIILKVDDDIVINMFKFFTDVYPKYSVKPKEILCNHIHPGTMLIIRNKNSKWYVHEDHFKGQKTYPRYCSGFMVMITNDVIPAIFRSASLTPFFWVDDVYLYGLAPGNVPGIHYNDMKKKDFSLSVQTALKCYRNETSTCEYLAVGASGRYDVIEVWSNMVNLYEQSRKVTTIAARKAVTTPMSGTTDGEIWPTTSSGNKPVKAIGLQVGKSAEKKSVDNNEDLKIQNT